VPVSKSLLTSATPITAHVLEGPPQIPLPEWSLTKEPPLQIWKLLSKYSISALLYRVWFTRLTLLTEQYSVTWSTGTWSVHHLSTVHKEACIIDKILNLSQAKHHHTYIVLK
jgi:hypothetical protein